MKSLDSRPQEAEFLQLVHEPRDAAAKALIARLADDIEGQEERARLRGPGKRKGLEEAVAAVIGGVLVSALRRGKMVLKSMREGEFSGHVGYTAAKTVFDGLAALGYLRHYPGVRFLRADFTDGGTWTGLASRYEATDTLIALAASHGITRDSVKQNFGTRYPVKAEKPEKLITLKQFKADGGASIRIPRSDEAHKRLQADVRTANKILSAHSWSANCQPPLLFRAFRHDWSFGGRWQVSGETPLQQMAAEDRLGILIDDKPVAEVDVRGSQISIVAARKGIHALPGDPYQMGPLAAFGRAVVKAAVTATLGTGKLRKTWPPDMGHTESMSEITSALVSAHPYLGNLSGLLGQPPGRIALRLQNLEAQCITAAMRMLWEASIPVVPIHDSLLVPADASEFAAEALREGYKAVTGAIIHTTVDRKV